MQKISRRKIALHACEELTSGTPVDKVVLQLAAYLVDSRQTAQTELLVRDIETILAKQYGIVLVKIVSARELSSQIIKSIEQFVSRSEGAKQVEVDTSVDPYLVGGVIIRTPSAELDMTVRKQLNNLRSI